VFRSPFGALMFNLDSRLRVLKISQFRTKVRDHNLYDDMAGAQHCWPSRGLWSLSQSQTFGTRRVAIASHADMPRSRLHSGAAIEASTEK
jgi:hypothetical protein